MRASLGVLVLAGLTVAGCFGGEEEAKPVTGAPKAAAAVISRLERATARADYRTICNDLFTPAAKRRAGGRDCPSLLRSQVGDVRDPRIQPLATELDGNRARMRVRSRSRGQPPATDNLELVRRGGRYRIDALGD